MSKYNVMPEEIRKLSLERFAICVAVVFNNEPARASFL